MMEIQKTEAFDQWLASLRDATTKRRILTRLHQVANGHLGVVEPVGGGVSELKLHFGPGYRIYFVQRGQTLIILLCGGSKASQARDIKKAKEIATQLQPETP